MTHPGRHCRRNSGLWGWISLLGVTTQVLTLPPEAIGRTYPLSEAPEAIRYLEEGHARGKIVITV
jgi:NADPH:quinone reductase-like Zn-dependent oxidoreductase